MQIHVSATQHQCSQDAVCRLEHVTGLGYQKKQYADKTSCTQTLNSEQQKVYQWLEGCGKLGKGLNKWIAIEAERSTINTIAGGTILYYTTKCIHETSLASSYCKLAFAKWSRTRTKVTLSSFVILVKLRYILPGPRSFYSSARFVTVLECAEARKNVLSLKKKKKRLQPATKSHNNGSIAGQYISPSLWTVSKESCAVN